MGRDPAIDGEDVAVTSKGAQRRFPSPLRYPGGKGKVASFVRLVLLENDLVGSEYVEPYAGGGAVALSLLFEDYASHIHINDLDPAVHAFWWACLNTTDELCRKIRDTPISTEEWDRQRAVQSDPTASPLDLAFSTFFMNRTNRSGIITGGIIGGRKQSGPWKLDARFNKDDLIRRIQKIGRFRNRISLTCLDAVEFLKSWQQGTENETFIYLDPPYYVKGGDLYRNSYGPNDHRDVAEAVGRLQVPWMVSYDAVPEILSLYRAGERVRYTLAYSAGTRGRGAEVMFFSEGTKVPHVDSPANVPLSVVDSVAAAAV